MASKFLDPARLSAKTLEMACIHEAGHAVVACNFAVPVLRVTQTHFTCGRTVGRKLTHSELQRVLTVSAAGHAAVKLFMADSPDDTGKLDERDATGLLKAQGVGKAHAAAMMRRAARRAARRARRAVLKLREVINLAALVLRKEGEINETHIGILFILLRFNPARGPHLLLARRSG
jgi:hypothetical protein